MKSLILLLFPILLFGQVNYPDTLILTNGKNYSCLITGISDSKIDMIYSNNRHESVIFKAIDRLSIEGLETVYTTNQGFLKEVDQVNEYVNSRIEKMTDEQLVQQELAKLTAVSNLEQVGEADSIELAEYFEFQKPFQMKKWSFGVLLIPYYSGRIYEMIYFSGSYPPEFYTGSYANNEINMQGQVAYAPASELMLTLDITYSSSYSERRSEYHRRNEYEEYDDGTKTTDGLYLFDFSVGVKYYFLKFYPGKVNIYALAGFGKQFASAEVTEEDLYPGPEPSPIIEDNLAEYLEGLNSPWHFDFGFGAEYLFNESLSLNTNIRFIYSTISSNYDYRYVSEFETRTQSIEYSSSEFITRIGLGINFYF